MKAVVLSLVSMICVAGLSGAVTLGSTRDEVVAAYGQPKGVTQAGAKEILIYAGGRVILEDGQVVRLDMKAPAASPAPPAAAPVVAPATPAPAARVEAPAPAVEWLTDFESAKAEAAAKKKRILALFTGSDWCPACIDFEAGVAHNADFLRVTQVSFVLLKLDYPRNTPQPPALQRQNAVLLRQYGIRAYPSLLVISADGEKSLKVDTQRGRPAADISDYFIQAVDEARKNFDQPKTWW
ncbi:MAG: thioredoxin family protein [Verrucomicrobia bacterium]|nr:thioredoxin family protein [Verrucomicrobiota bacterium]